MDQIKTGRNIYLVAYDVSDSKRLRDVYKMMRGFGMALQYSVFLCELSGKEKVLLIEALTEIIHHEEDRVIIVDLGPGEGRGKECIEFLGRRGHLPERSAVVV